MTNRIIMCVDDEREVLESLVRDLYPRYGREFRIETCESAAEAQIVRTSLAQQGDRVELYIVDQRMPGVKGIDFLKGVEQDAGRILLTAYADIDVAVSGINEKCIDFYMRKPYGDELFKSMNHLILAREKGVFVTLARTEGERDQALKTQNAVFSELHLEVPYEEGVRIIGTSPYTPSTEIYVAVFKRQMIGTTSLSRKNEALASEVGSLRGLPIEEFYDIQNISALDTNLVQVRNATVLPEYQHMGIGPMIWGELYRELTRKEPVSTYAVILAASEIRDANIAQSVYSRIEQRGYLRHGISISRKQENETTPSQPTENEPALIPKLLRMYHKMGFQFIGPPVYYPNFRMFDFPMLLKIKETTEPYRTMFESGRL